MVLVCLQADKDSAVESTIAGLESRCARLAAELEDTAVALEVARAKAAMYDELQAKADKLVRGRGSLHGEVEVRLVAASGHLH